jgi:hypothetical protein
MPYGIYRERGGVKSFFKNMSKTINSFLFWAYGNNSTTIQERQQGHETDDQGIPASGRNEPEEAGGDNRGNPGGYPPMGGGQNASHGG